MKIQCSVCEAAEAKVLCCADEAALCWSCDQKVHAANKLATKHHRVLLSASNSSHMPKCDICQEIVGYFFCLQDRALLCRKCDTAIHSTNTLVSLHQRFILTGVRVGLEASESWPSSSTSKARSDEKISGPECHSVPQLMTPSSFLGGSDFTMSNLSFAGGSAAGNVTQWPLDELLRIDGFNQNSNFVNNGLSKANSAKLGVPICSGAVRGSLVANLDQMPETFWAVPQITSQLKESELQLFTHYQNPSDCATFVPDVSSQWFQISPLHLEPCGTSSKRRREF